jgi:diadenosine tetraphosphate (Ap4A) HIT family hydrolase
MTGGRILAFPMPELPDCLYCRKDQRLHDLMIEITPMRVSTLYLFREQTHRGRCIVAYRDHVNELFEVPQDALALFAQDVAAAAKAIKAAVGAQKINYGAYSDKLPHLHMHLVPKFQDGPAWGAPFEMMPAVKKHLPEAEIAQLMASIKQGL